MGGTAARTIRLRGEGWEVNRKRVQRLWREEGLRVPVRRRKRRRLGESTLPADRLRAERPNHVWALDFQYDQTAEGRVMTLLNIVDEFTREALEMLVERNIDADAVTATPERLVGRAWRARVPTVDNGPEMTAHAAPRLVPVLSQDRGPRTSSPGSPWQNPYVEASTPACVRAARRRGVLLPGRGAGRDLRLARGLQPAAAALRARDERRPPCSPPSGAGEPLAAAA